MAILTIGKILKEAGLDTSKRIKLVRHKDNNKEQTIEGIPVKGSPTEWYMTNRQYFDSYQCEQGKNLFKDVDYIISFLGEEGTSARFIGVYKVLGLDQERIDRVNNGNLFYRMEEVPGFDEFKERVIIDWGKNTITWHQWLDRNDKEIVAIKRKGIDWVCPDYDQIKISYEQLKRIFNDRIDIWKNRLTACNCIYMISDSKSGKLYVGSTYNREGIWGRWAEYASTGHGGNVELEKLIEKDSDYAKNFTWSILQTLPLNIDGNKAIAIETLWKEKLGRNACALNRN